MYDSVSKSLSFVTIRNVSKLHNTSISVRTGKCNGLLK